MKAKSYSILARAVEEGFKCGWRRAHKHVENPDEQAIETSVTNEIMNAISEVFSFDDDLPDN